MSASVLMLTMKQTNLQTEEICLNTILRNGNSWKEREGELFNLFLLMKKVLSIKFRYFSAGFPLQGQPAVHGFQLPAAVCACLLCFPNHPQGKDACNSRIHSSVFVV